MSYDERNEPAHGITRFRPTLHISIGILYLVFGGAVIYLRQFGKFELPGPLAYGLGGLMLIYGAFRIWRGISELRARKLDSIKRDLNEIDNTPS